MADCASRECNPEHRGEVDTDGANGCSHAFKGETFLRPPARITEVISNSACRGCCNLVGGGQKPFITKMPAGRSL